MLPVDFGGAVALQLAPGRGGQQLLGRGGAAQLVIGPFDPVAPELGQEDEGERALTPQHLEEDQDHHRSVRVRHAQSVHVFTCCMATVAVYGANWKQSEASFCLFIYFSFFPSQGQCTSVIFR